MLPRSEYDVRRQLDVVRRAVNRFGIRAQFTGRNDLVIEGSGSKFSGNAFRFSGDAALHHGTIMVNVDMDRLGRYLAPDDGKLKAKGIDSVRARVANLAGLNPEITIPALTGALMDAFADEYGTTEGAVHGRRWTPTGWRRWRGNTPPGISGWARRCPSMPRCSTASTGAA